MFNFSINEKTIDINEIDELIGTINLIDIREPHEFKCGTIRTAKNIPMDTLLDNLYCYNLYIQYKAFGRESQLTIRKIGVI